MEGVYICIFAVLLVALVFILLISNAKEEREYNANLKREYAYQAELKRERLPLIEIISCECPELATWHPGRIQHKLRCPKFRKLNPYLSVKQFMYTEGFPQEEDTEWPEI